MSIEDSVANRINANQKKDQEYLRLQEQKGLYLSKVLFEDIYNKIVNEIAATGIYSVKGSYHGVLIGTDYTPLDQEVFDFLFEFSTQTEKKAGLFGTKSTDTVHITKGAGWNAFFQDFNTRISAEKITVDWQITTKDGKTHCIDPTSFSGLTYTISSSMASYNSTQYDIIYSYER